MLAIEVHALVYGSSEFLDIVHFLSVLFVDLSDNFERSVGLTENLEDLLSVIVDASLLFYLHAVIGSLGALNMEVDLAVMLGALDDCTILRSFFAADNTPDIELGKVKPIHLDRSPRGDLRAWHPHRAAMMHPVIKCLSLRGVLLFKLFLISLQESAVVFWDAMILFFVLVEYKFVVILSL